MKKSSLTLLLLCFTAVFSALVAQTTVSGKVTDEAGEALIGANVAILGTSDGATTDIDGGYEFSTKARGEVTIQVSYLGYSPIRQTITLAGTRIAQDFSMGEDALGLDEIVVTGSANPKSKLESSVSISSINAKDISLTANRSTAEIFRTVPGVRSEASAGEGNTNITVRGVPISSGGSKYLQLQEDGLPILLFGDIAFATSDIFLRMDNSVARIEALRGGSASTLSSNSPAGIINFISKTGMTEGGSIGTTIGMTYKDFRTDFNYGAPIGNGMAFHIGGFFRQGNGARTAGYTANMGGQIKANLTKTFSNGHIRFYYKYLNDRTAAYMPMPINVTGTNEDPKWSAIEGFDPVLGTLHTPNLLQNLGPGPDGALRRADIADGMNPQSHSIGNEFVFNFDGGWGIENRARMSFNKGRFVAPFPAEVGPAAGLATSIGGAGSTLTYADNGAAFSSANGLAMRMHLFDTELNNFNNFMNDLKIKKSFGDVATITLGYFKSNQNINMSWLWNSYLLDVNGNGGRLLNVQDSTGNFITENGLIAYGVPAWGNCCTRNYNTKHAVSAPYMAVEAQVIEGLNVDASFRWDIGSVNGNFAGAAQSIMDVNGDGNISVPEQSVSSVNNSNVTVVDYDYNYISYSLGLNYKFNDKQAVFARYSRGGSAKADRILFSGLNYTESDQLNAKDMIDQAEVGYKLNFKRGGLFATAFYASTKEEGGFEATTQRIIENDYRALGLELEAAYNIAGFNLRGGLTYTNAQITGAADSTLNGNAPRRQPALMYSFTPTYEFKLLNNNHAVGLSVIGQSKAFAQDNNLLVMPGYTFVNMFVNFGIAKNLNLSINANNLFNAMGITESEEGSIVEGQNNIVRARSIMGRSVVGTVRYNF
jgi:outer membrane receptor protein involved in Fe transport